jgi:hypothetical protein
MLSHAIAQEVSHQIPAAAAWFDPKSGHVGSMVGKMALGQVFSEHFSFPCQFSFHQMPHSQHHLPFGAGTMGQIVADVPSGLSPTPPQGIRKKNKVQVCTGPIHIKPEFTKQL